MGGAEDGGGNLPEVVPEHLLATRDEAKLKAALESDDDFYDEVEIEDMELDEEEMVFKYPCPCGDEFRISLDAIYGGEVVATCPSCSLLLKVIYDPEDFVDSDSEGDDDA